MRSRQQRIERRLDRFNFPDDLSRPMMCGSNLHYELAGRAVGTAYGGIGLVHQLVERLELAREIDRRVSVFKLHMPYFESDHVLNLIYNAMCDGLGRRCARKRGRPIDVRRRFNWLRVFQAPSRSEAD